MMYRYTIPFKNSYIIRNNAKLIIGPFSLLARLNAWALPTNPFSNQIMYMLWFCSKKSPISPPSFIQHIHVVIVIHKTMCYVLVYLFALGHSLTCRQANEVFSIVHDDKWICGDIPFTIHMAFGSVLSRPNHNITYRYILRIIFIGKSVEADPDGNLIVFVSFVKSGVRAFTSAILRNN